MLRAEREREICKPRDYRPVIYRKGGRVRGTGGEGQGVVGVAVGLI